MPETMSADEATRLAQVVTTGAPAVSLLACRRCGVLLWDIAAHYEHAHPGER